ncbi:MAG: thioredoxin-disulfide reductase [Candidatus Aenigmatarchaeota archaeon]
MVGEEHGVKMERYDLIIVGGGPAGLTAGMYSARRKLKTLIITMNVGGQALLSQNICNYPGFLNVSGINLVNRMKKQVEKAGAEITLDEVKQILPKENEFLVKTETRDFLARALILAFGKKPRVLNVPGEREFIGRGVSYCATCDAPLFKNKIVAVIGGGNSALDAALLLSEFASKVYLIHRRDEFRGFEALVEEVKERKNIELMMSCIVTEIKGKEKVNSIVVKDLKTEQAREVNVDGIFVEIGYEVDPSLVKGLVKLDEYNQIVVDSKCRTFYPDSDKIRPGVFAAGDVTNVVFKQIVVAAGEGAKAALAAYNYLHGVEDFQIVGDWLKR